MELFQNSHVAQLRRNELSTTILNPGHEMRRGLCYLQATSLPCQASYASRLQPELFLYLVSKNIEV
jgi:hypothetical protein